jgi:RNA polymerase sigma-70 factor (ECF subfamily)
MRVSEGHQDESSEYQLLERCKSKDAVACNVLLERYNRRIFNTAYRILGEPAWAEDAVQETLMNVYRGLASFRGDAQVSTWISRITVNVCLGMMRKGRGKRLIALEEDDLMNIPADPTPYNDPEEHAATGELSEMIDRAFSAISEKHSRVVRLHDMEGYTIQEIARIIRCPAGTVKSRLFYGRQEFREAFDSLQKTPRHTVH